jgi:hypothetical protein
MKERIFPWRELCSWEPISVWSSGRSKYPRPLVAAEPRTNEPHGRHAHCQQRWIVGCPKPYWRPSLTLEP